MPGLEGTRHCGSPLMRTTERVKKQIACPNESIRTMNQRTTVELNRKQCLIIFTHPSPRPQHRRRGLYQRHGHHPHHRSHCSYCQCCCFLQTVLNLQAKDPERVACSLYTLPTTGNPAGRPATSNRQPPNPGSSDIVGTIQRRLAWPLAQG